MTKFERLEKKIRSFTSERQERDILKIVKSSQEFLIDLNTLQLMDGKDIHGVFIGPPYRSKAYAEFKLFLNPKGVVDLFLTGKFHRSIFIKASSFPVLFDAKDPKKDMLINKYGDVIGISEQGKETFIQHIRPEIINYYTNIVKL